MDTRPHRASDRHLPPRGDEVSPKGLGQLRAAAHGLEHRGHQATVGPIDRPDKLDEELGQVATDAPGVGDREPLGWVGSSDRYAAVVEDILASPAVSVLGCERAVDAARRFEDAILSFALAHPGRSVVAVSHGIVLTLYMSRLLGIAPPSVSIWRSLRFSDRAVVQPESRRVIECFGGVRQWPRLD